MGRRVRRETREEKTYEWRAGAHPGGRALDCSIAGAQGKPNIILILSETSATAAAQGRGMPTPSLARLADEGMTFFSCDAQPSCTPGRAAVQTGRIPNRSG